MDTIFLILILVMMACLLQLGWETTTVRKALKRQSGIASGALPGHLSQFRYCLISMTALLAFFLTVSWVKSGQDRTKMVEQTREIIKSAYDSTNVWRAPQLSLIQVEENKDLILYGRQLIANTSDFLGPKGVVQNMSNGMNCQNCHLDAGTKPFGNNYAAVLSTYPKFRARSGTNEDIAKRINDCFQRSLNGDSLKAGSRELKAIIAYIHWLGQAVPKNKIPLGTGLERLQMLDRPADPEKGKLIYLAKCQTCHGATGQGLPMPEHPSSRYPPLWGEGSYNTGAGLYRLSSFASYVKTNMPFGVTKESTELTDEEAWDLAAFVNSQPRPDNPLRNIDWPVISQKPFDHPFGPFADTFSVDQHKYGPFQPIIAFQKSIPK